MLPQIYVLCKYLIQTLSPLISVGPLCRQLSPSESHYNLPFRIMQRQCPRKHRTAYFPGYSRPAGNMLSLESLSLKDKKNSPATLMKASFQSKHLDL